MMLTQLNIEIHASVYQANSVIKTSFPLISHRK